MGNHTAFVLLYRLQWGAACSKKCANQLSRSCAHVVTADGKPLAHDPQPNHQNFTFPGTPSVQLQWSLQGNNQLPSISVTSGAQRLGCSRCRVTAEPCSKLVSNPCVTAASKGTAETGTRQPKRSCCHSYRLPWAEHRA